MRSGKAVCCLTRVAAKNGALLGQSASNKLDNTVEVEVESLRSFQPIPPCGKDPALLHAILDSAVVHTKQIHCNHRKNCQANPFIPEVGYQFSLHTKCILSVAIMLINLSA